MKKPYTSIASLLGMFFIFAVAIGLENWIYRIRQLSRQEFGGVTGLLSWLVPENLAYLLLAGLLLTWLWFVYNKDQNFRVVATIYILAGLGLLFYNVVAISFSSSSSPQMPLPMLPNQSLSTFTSSVIAVVGLQKLFSRKSVS